MESQEAKRIEEDQRTSTWQNDPRRAPELKENDELVIDEAGRVLYWTEDKHTGSGVDCRSHWFRVVKAYGTYYLLVRHGGGDETIRLQSWGWSMYRSVLDSLSSDARYWLLHMIYSAHRDGVEKGTTKTGAAYQQAFVEGRLKKRRARGSNTYKVWINPSAQ